MTEKLTIFETVGEACRWLGLTPRERTLLRDCVWARQLVANGNFLVQPSRMPAARRMIERGYLRQSENQPVLFDPEDFGLVVVMDQPHLDKLITDANATLTPPDRNPSSPESSP
jgi:hypothetical protein